MTPGTVPAVYQPGVIICIGVEARTSCSGEIDYYTAQIVMWGRRYSHGGRECVCVLGWLEKEVGEGGRARVLTQELMLAFSREIT